MKKLISVVFLMLGLFAIFPACSQEEVAEEQIPKYEGSYLIQGDKIYVKRYAYKGMRYDPKPIDSLPDFIKKSEERMKMIDIYILLEGYYEGQTTYWMHYTGSSDFFPLRYSEDGKCLDRGNSFKEIDYTKLTCIYVGEHYF